MKQDDKFLIVVKEFIKNLVISLVAVIVLTQFVAKPVRVDGSSMYPTLEDKEIGFSNIISLKINDVTRFDVVVVAMEEPEKNIVKRIIGLPGDTVESRGDVLYINGNAMKEPFLETDYVRQFKADNGHFTVDFGPVKVPENSYFVMGDNRPRSSDSRDRGSFDHALIKSKSVFVIVPFNKIRNVGK